MNKEWRNSGWRKYDCWSITVEQASRFKLSTQITRMRRKDCREKRNLNGYGVLNLSTGYKESERTPL